MGEFNSIDEFLGHKGSGSGNGRLGDWKKDGTVETWMHTKKLPLTVSRHQIPRLVSFEDKNTGAVERKVWTDFLVCPEEEALLRRLRRPGKGARPAPKTCGLCRVGEYLRNEVEAGRMSIATPVFRFSGDTDIRVILAGGFYNGFRKLEKLSQDERKALTEQRFNAKEAWQQNGLAKENYLFCLVDHDNIEEGVQVAIETSLLGEKVQALVNDRMLSLGQEDGNPWVKPVCIQWEYKESAENIQDRYHARALEKVLLTPQIQELIQGQPPDLSEETEPMNQMAVRATLERHALIQLPWDQLFPGTSAGAAIPMAEPELRKTGFTQNAVPAQIPAPPVPPPPPEASVEMVECDSCGKPMRLDQDVCPHCGHDYRPAPPPPPAPPMRKRGAAAVSPAPVGAIAPVPQPAAVLPVSTAPFRAPPLPPAPASGGGDPADLESQDFDDGIPFITSGGMR